MAQKKEIFGVLYGLAGGLAFALTAWGWDAYQLWRAHWAYPLLSFLPGAVLALLLGGLAGWLAMRLRAAALGALAWLIGGSLLGILTLWLPRWLTPRLIFWLEPALQGWASLPPQEGAPLLILLCIGVTALFALIAGALQFTLVEQATYSQGDGAILLPMMLSVAVMALAGILTDSILNINMRQAVSSLDYTLTFAIENQDKEVDKLIARRARLGAVNSLTHLFQIPHRIFFFDATSSFEQSRYLVQFEENWAQCTLILSNLTYCKPVTPP